MDGRSGVLDAEDRSTREDGSWEQEIGIILTMWTMGEVAIFFLVNDARDCAIAFPMLTTLTSGQFHRRADRTRV